MRLNRDAPEVRLLRRVIRRSGLSARRYAKEVLTRDERTVRRWLAGETAIPRAVIAFLKSEAAYARAAARVFDRPEPWPRTK